MTLDQELHYPPKGFYNNFVDEKSFRKNVEDHYSGGPWGEIRIADIREDGTVNNDTGIDPDIFELVNAINRIHFLYTKGQSCSGSLKDHGNYTCHVKDIGIDQSVYQGFIQLRVDSSDRKFSIFQKGIRQLYGVELHLTNQPDEDDKYQRQPGVKNMVIQAIVPEFVLDESHPSHKTYLTDIWNNVQGFTKRFYAPTREEKIKMNIAIRSNLKGIRIDKSIRDSIRRNIKNKF